MTSDELARARAFVAQARWIFASTAPAWMPNEYALRRDCNEAEFAAFLDLITRRGYDRPWGRGVYRSLDLDGWTYWRQDKYDAVLVHRARPEPPPPQLRLEVDPRCEQCGTVMSQHPIGDGLTECPGDYGADR
jgi:hypothetical protein